MTGYMTQTRSMLVANSNLARYLSDEIYVLCCALPESKEEIILLPHFFSMLYYV